MKKEKNVFTTFSKSHSGQESGGGKNKYIFFKEFLFTLFWRNFIILNFLSKILTREFSKRYTLGKLVIIE